MGTGEREDELLRSVALHNADNIESVRQHADQDLLETRKSLEIRTQELAYSLAMMRAMLESTKDGILATDADARITGFNQKFVEMWAIPHDLLNAGQHLPLLDRVKTRFRDPQMFLSRVKEIYQTAPVE